ncbi:MAG: hypothetical protein EOO14_12255 [Chitinophagaceae bacterium]|nr:MAG: hypothetical protein EOO14_12255 [Chitinophagaceae bacterium]
MGVSCFKKLYNKKPPECSGGFFISCLGPIFAYCLLPTAYCLLPTSLFRFLTATAPGPQQVFSPTADD